MKKIINAVLLCLVIGTFTISCKKNEPALSSEVSPEVLAKINDMGFNNQNVHKWDGGYLVEGDIFISEEDLGIASTSTNLRIAEVEQYRTNNLVKNLPRTITVKVTNLPTVYLNAADEAINRYNAQNLQLHFQRITSGTAEITVDGFYQGPSGGFITLGSAGFPTKNGNPYKTIKLNTHPQAYGENPDLLYVASVIQHEMGHCIGFRHTDYMDRAYSCGSGGSEGASNIGAVHIPGTPTGPDNNSWMLACSNGGNRTFNNNDKVALNYLY
jgi:hypothetical protein